MDHYDEDDAESVATGGGPEDDLDEDQLKQLLRCAANATRILTSRSLRGLHLSLPFAPYSDFSASIIGKFIEALRANHYLLELGIDFFGWGRAPREDEIKALLKRNENLLLLSALVSVISLKPRDETTGDPVIFSKFKQERDAFKMLLLKDGDHSIASRVAEFWLSAKP